MLDASPSLLLAGVMRVKLQLEVVLFEHSLKAGKFQSNTSLVIFNIAISRK